MAKTKLKRMDRFELLELIYDMRKVNLELTERLEAAEKKIEELKKEADLRVDDVRNEYMQRLDDLRMQGTAKELQKRMKEIEEQLLLFQRITGRDAAAVRQEDAGLKTDLAGIFTPPVRETPVSAAGSLASAQKKEAASAAPDGEAGESKE